MTNTRARLTLVAALLVVPLLGGVGYAQESSPTPPTDLKFVNDHWTAWDPPEAAEGAYIIVKGDTLWDLAERWLGDPFLWPQIWDENRYIEDSHWIYPGDPLVIPGKPTVVPEEGPPPIVEETGEEPDIDVPYGQDEPEEAERAEPLPAPLVPIADAQDIYCSGYIAPEHTPSGLSIEATENEGQNFVAEGHVVYLNQGRNQGLQPGDEFAVVRPIHEVLHPESGQSLGGFVRRLGSVRVMLSHDNSATAVVTMSCQEIAMGDELVPWQEIPVPMMRSLPEFDRYDGDGSGGTAGHIVHLPEDIDWAAAGHIIHTDLGVASGVRPGDVLNVFFERGELPRINVGQAVILTVEPMTSTAKLTYSVREAAIGHRVEVR